MKGNAPGWLSLPRRVLMHTASGRRFWWRRGRNSEVDFWFAWLTGAPGTEEWASDRESRFDPATPIRDPLVRAELERIAADEISIVDVGAGPVTALGFSHPGKKLSIVAVDPLADEYDRLLRDAGLRPPVRTRRVAGEELLEHFGSQKFDLAYASNALDHSADPFRIISNMVAVVRPSGVVLLRHKRNEADNARYGGLHQWNFDTRDGSLFLWNNAVELNISAELASSAATVAWNERNEVLARIVVRASM